MENITYESGTAPVLTASKTTTIPLAFSDSTKEAVSLRWTNPNYQFTTGVSSQDVTYLLEIDTTGANFKSLSRQSISISKELGVSFTNTQLNDYLLNQLQLKVAVPHNIEMRVTSSINSTVPLVSNVLKFITKPYSIPPKVDTPASGKLFITGSATPGSWQCACGEPELLTQKLTRVSATLYEITLPLTGGGSYKLIPVYASWNTSYGFTGASNANNVDSDDFKLGGNDIKAPAVSGNYKITVDFQRGKFTVVKI
jgi:hypothetical protein